ncbi:MAG: AGE family epimerase/isomerase [Candidatus Latescibacteria bacterium]|jgi:mannose/cellobiose epimerase-like protein (N-acyl-D-glucosamine 2-epimerase family)|nr:AGE family epimerase/isomerase [Candidatus Latescibacterota bacterium]
MVTEPKSFSDGPVRETLAGFSPESLRDQYRADLFDDYLAFWDRHGIDREHGGFMCSLDHDGTQVSTDKNGWHQGRGLWAYSFLYNHFGGDQYLEIAREARDFIVRHGRDEEGNWAITLDREGNVLRKDGVGYAALFVAEGLQEYAEATGDTESWDLAVDSLHRGWERFSDPRATRFEDAPTSYPGIRSLGSHMVAIRVLTQMLEKGQDPKLESFAEQVVDAIVNRFWNPEYRLTNEFLTNDYQRPDDDNEDYVVLGHAMETLWMVLAEAVRLKDRTLLDLVGERLQRHIEVAWDDVYDGLFCGIHVNGETKTPKYLWTQEEVLVGCMILLEHTDLDWPEYWFGRVYRYVQEKFPLKQYGHPMYILSADRKVTFQPRVSRKGNYHRPRHLMLNLLALERMIART